MSEPFPFSAIVGQEDLLEALLINASVPEVGGLLVRGKRGTAKSTAVRALLPLLPEIMAAESERFAFAPGELGPNGPVPRDAPLGARRPPLVEVPLAATLDRLVGSLDLGRALAGERAFEAGLLARAHRGVLYVDEVNLLPDHLVDALLDAAASGTARIEREAVSVEHAARFLLVGTMNLEEGELRPQLLDRFGLAVTVETPADPRQRAEIVRRRLEFARDPGAFHLRFGSAQVALAARVAEARKRVNAVRLPERELQRIAGACARLEVDGVRGDITCAVAAKALAALDGEDEVTAAHVERAARYALCHRLRRDPLAPPGTQPPEVADAFDEPADPADGRGPAGPHAGTDHRGVAAPQRPDPVPAALPDEALRLPDRGAGPGGRRARSAGPAAGTIDSRPADGNGDDLAAIPSLVASLAAGAPAPRAHVREGREGALICFVVDASGSMGARRRAARMKGALLRLLRDAYARRDRVMVVAFRGERAELVVTAETPLERAAASIRALETGGTTPLAAGIRMATDELLRAAARERTRRSIAILITDGRAADPRGEARRAVAALARATDAFHVVDTEDGPARLGLAAALARAAGACVHRLVPEGALA